MSISPTIIPIAFDLVLFTVTAVAWTINTRWHRTIERIGGVSLLSHKALVDGTTLSSKELVCTVDDNNVPTSEGRTRNLVRLHNLWHRATYVVVLHASRSGTQKEENGSYPRLIVQKRSKLKDYFPGKLDATPGGVVGFGESYTTNVTRELEEEMGISVNSSLGDGSPNRLFTFKYRDEHVRVWGDLWLATYEGRLEDLVLQEEEVEEVMSLSIDNVEQMIEDHPEDWMPDGIHAIRLYLQHERDASIGRKLLKSAGANNYPFSDRNSYRLRPPVQAIFFDCDDCLYFDQWKIADLLTARIERWFCDRGHPKGFAYGLYQKHGTTLRGLLEEGLIDGENEDEIDECLREFHDISVGMHLKRDESLRSILEGMNPTIPKYVFTASVRHHAERCLDALGIKDLFAGIIDVKTCEYATKHSPEAFKSAMRFANVSDPSSCLFFDDSVKNIAVGAKIGWRCVLVGRVGRDCGELISANGSAEYEIERIHEFPKIFPELFPGKP